MSAQSQIQAVTAQINNREGLDPIVRITATIVSAGVNIDTDKDGEIELNEIFNASQKAVTSLLMNAPQINREDLQASISYVRANKGEVIEVVKEYNEMQDFENDEVEELVEYTLLTLAQNVDLAFRFIDIAKARKLTNN